MYKFGIKKISKHILDFLYEIFSLQKGLIWFFPIFYVYLAGIIFFIYIYFLDLNCGDIFCYEFNILLPVYVLGVVLASLSGVVSYLGDQGLILSAVILSIFAGFAIGAFLEKFIIKKRSYKAFFVLIAIFIAGILIFPTYWTVSLCILFPFWPVFIFLRLKVADKKFVKTSFWVSISLLALLVVMTVLSPMLPM